MAAISSNADGKWITDAATTWVGGVAPAEGDTATILNTHDVEIDGDITVGADSATAAIQVNSGGSLFVPSTVAGDYTLTLKGDLKTDGTGGTINFGTAANPIPNTRIFTVKTNYSASLADGKYGLIINTGGTFNCQGADRWSNGLTDPDRTLLAANAAANDTSITVADSTAWTANDWIAIASTTRTRTECEKFQVNSVVGTTINVKSGGGAGGGLQYAHSGTSPTQAELINLTRNVIITSQNTSYCGWVYTATTSTVNIDWTEFSYLGYDATSKRGLDINNTTNNARFTRVALHDFEARGFWIYSASNVIIEDSVVYNITGGNHALSTATSGNTLDNIIIILTVGSCFSISASQYITNCKGIGAADYGFDLLGICYQFDNITAHSNNNAGVHINSYLSQNKLIMDNIICWRNNNPGINIEIMNGPLTINNPIFFGNNNYNISIGYGYDVTLNSPILNGDSTFSTGVGLKLRQGGSIVTIFDGDFGTAGGIKVAHATDDISWDANASISRISMVNTILASGTEVTMTNALRSSYIRSQDHDATAGNQKVWRTSGIIVVDTSYYNTDSPSFKMSPNSASNKLSTDIELIKIPVASGANPTISVYFRKSAAYNGNQPRLIVRRNDSLGITADTVIATSAAAVDVDTPPGTFTQLSGQPGAVSADGVIEVFVDCDGTAGYINICDWAVTGAKTQADNLDAYYSWGLPFNGLLSASTGGGGGGPIFRSGGIFN